MNDITLLTNAHILKNASISNNEMDMEFDFAICHGPYYF